MPHATYPALLAHCDWSVDHRKRWMATATRQAGGWHVLSPEPVRDAPLLLDELRQRTGGRGSILVGFDFPIGLPEKYGELTGLADFQTALRAFGSGRWREWFDVCEAREQIAITRPFYPVRPGGKKREHLFDGLGLGSADLLRHCERATASRPAACSLFWTLGGNQVGKAAIAGWREVIAPNIERAGLWPYDGRLTDLIASHETVLVETYPGDVYGQIGLPRKASWSKRTQQGRALAGLAMIDWLRGKPVTVDKDLADLITDGFSARSVGEDQFDAVVGLLGMIEVVSGRWDEGCPDLACISRWEGWILGQNAPVHSPSSAPATA